MLPKNRKMDNPNTLHMIAARYAFEPSCFDVHNKKINIRDRADKIYQHEHLLKKLFFFSFFFFFYLQSQLLFHRRGANDGDQEAVGSDPSHDQPCAEAAVVVVLLGRRAAGLMDLGDLVRQL